MGLSAKTIELVALGAAVAGNCIPCLEWHYKKCVGLGISEGEIKQAIAMAKKVKQVPIKKIDEVAAKLLGQSSGSEPPPGLGKIELG